MEEKQNLPSAPQDYGFQAPPAYEQIQHHQQQYEAQSEYIPQGQPQTQFIAGQTLRRSINYVIQNLFSVVTTSSFGPEPSTITCPSCMQRNVTTVSFTPTEKTNLWACVLCVCCFPFCCLPYMMDSCKDATHYCSHCGAYVGTYRRP